MNPEVKTLVEAVYAAINAIGAERNVYDTIARAKRAEMGLDDIRRNVDKTVQDLHNATQSLVQATKSDGESCKPKIYKPEGEDATIPT